MKIDFEELMGRYIAFLAVLGITAFVACIVAAAFTLIRYAFTHP